MLFEAAFGITGAIYDPAYLRPKKGAGTHWAGLQGHVKGAFLEVFGT